MESSINRTQCFKIMPWHIHSGYDCFYKENGSRRMLLQKKVRCRGKEVGYLGS